jgi:hypothetical protein
MADTDRKEYARGYNAGRKRVDLDISREAVMAERQAFLERAFLAALPACIVAQDWKRGDKPITNMTQRTALAWDFAEEALKNRRYPA